MLTQEQLQALKAPFPDAALSADTSRGFELTSIKAAYVIERLNDVFGVCGIGWRYVHSDFEMLDTKNGGVEVITEVAFQYRLADIQEHTHGCPPIEWCPLTKGWSCHDASAAATWSEPIFACGGKLVVKGGAPYTDARKSAVTDGLTKAASMLGVGHTVFKGLIRVSNRQRDNNGHHPPTEPQTTPAQGKPTQQPTEHKEKGNGQQHPAPVPSIATPPIAEESNATAFWALYNREAKPLGIPRTEVQKLVYNDNWGQACANLRVLIAKTQKPIVTPHAN